MLPMLAEDAVLEKIKFPCFIQPKIDGVRSKKGEGGPLTGRSLKCHASRVITTHFSNPIYNGFDGEMFKGTDPTAENLCADTSSLLSTIESTEIPSWMLFDYVTRNTKDLVYEERLVELWKTVTYGDYQKNKIKIIDNHWCNGIDYLLFQEKIWLEAGYEGVIVRDPNGKYKEGRSTVREGGLLRIKRFIEEEAIVLGLTEGEANNNVKQVNELGKSFRTSHKANKAVNGMVGNLLCRTLKDIYCPIRGVLLFKAGTDITVSPGKLTHVQRKYYWENQGQILNERIKFKFFPKGIKDQPRFATFQSFRIESDIGL